MPGFIHQFNIAWMREPFDSELFDDFRERLSELHDLADNSAGFVWRHDGTQEKNGYIQPYSSLPLVMGNYSIWSDYDSLFYYTFSGGHMDLMRDRKKWFEPAAGRTYSVLWVEDSLSDGSIDEGKMRIECLKSWGDTQQAFGFGKRGKELARQELARREDRSDVVEDDIC